MIRSVVIIFIVTTTSNVFAEEYDLSNHSVYNEIHILMQILVLNDTVNHKYHTNIIFIL